jgi:hypothetical protein
VQWYLRQCVAVTVMTALGPNGPRMSGAHWLRSSQQPGRHMRIDTRIHLICIDPNC